MINVNPLFDINFLTELLESQEREIYARITALTQNEMPIEYIEGRVTGGSINVDGASALRRTCNLSMVAQDVNINEFYWGLKNKFKLEVGLKNNINKIYPDIIWFKQGLFIITTFNTTQSVNNWTISISGKDKMCLLNGEVAGALPHTTDFGLEENYDKITDTVTYRSIPIKEIIRESVQNFGNELASNIIINDIENAGLELLEYRGDTPLYMFREINSQQFKNMTLNPNQTCYYYLDYYISGDRYRALVNNYSIDIANQHYSRIDDNLYILISDIDKPFKGKVSDAYILYDNLVEQLDGEAESTTITLTQEGTNIKQYKIAKFEYGSTPGYRLTDLVYAGELICNAGEPLTSMLDKIKNMLGDFEYFYNIDGKFVFQKKRNNIVSPWNQSESNEELYSDANINNGAYAYNFANSHLISSFQNNPNLLNLKNDYSIWGTAKRNNVEFPIHLRYAIDHRPESYTTIPWYNVDGSVKKESKTFTSIEYDWRELIYQMALDYRQNYHNDDFLSEVIKYNYPNFVSGKTGYEQYYVDLEGFWRELYNPEAEMFYDLINYEELPIYKDSIYIQHAYRKLREEELNLNLDLKKVFVLEDNNLYPYLGSKYCHLVEGDEYFYISDTNTLAWSNEKYILNQVALDKIYTKGRQQFNVQLESERYELIDLDKYSFESNKYYILNENGEYKLAATYYDNMVYYNKIISKFNTIYYQRVEVDLNNFEQGKYYIFNEKTQKYELATQYDNNKDYYIENLDYEPYLVYENAKIELPFSEVDKRDYTLYVLQYHPSLLTNDIKQKLYIKDYNYTEYENFENNIFNFYQSNFKENDIIINDIKCPRTLKIIQHSNYGENTYVKINLTEEYFIPDKYYIYDKNNKLYILAKTYTPNQVYYEFTNVINEVVNYTYGYYNYYHNEENDGNYWVKTITDKPELLNFWFDFLECENTDIMKYSVPVIGSRTKVINDKDVKTIYYKEIPTTIFMTKDQFNNYDSQPGYTYIQLQNTMANLFTISSKGKSAKEKLDELLYQHSYCVETATLSTLPVYHLQPNNKIYIRDNESKVEGEYIVDKLTIPLTYNGMMSITARKAVSNIT